MEDQRKAFKNKQTASATAGTKKRNEVVQKITGSENLHLVKSDFEEYMELFDKYKNHLRYSTRRRRQRMLRQKLDEKETAFIGFKTQVLAWIRQMEHELQDQFDRKSMKSHSNCHDSSRSHMTGISMKSAWLNDKAKITELMVQNQMLEEARQLAEQKV